MIKEYSSVDSTFSILWTPKHETKKAKFLKFTYFTPFVLSWVIWWGFTTAELSLIADAHSTRRPDKFKLIYLFCCETEARQVSLFGGRSQAGFLIWNSALYTHEKQFGTNILPLYFFLLRLKFDNGVMIKLGRAARLWNGHKWRNGARFQNKMRTNAPNKLADGVLNRFYVKWDFVNTNQHSSTKG